MFSYNIYYRNRGKYLFIIGGIENISFTFCTLDFECDLFSHHKQRKWTVKAVCWEKRARWCCVRWTVWWAQGKWMNSGRHPGIFHIHTHTHGNPWPLNTGEQEQFSVRRCTWYSGGQQSLDLSKEFCNFASDTAWITWWRYTWFTGKPQAVW